MSAKKRSAKGEEMFKRHQEKLQRDALYAMSHPSPAPRVRRSTYGSHCYDSLGDLLATGQSVRLITERDGAVSVRWTLKAVLEMPEGQFGMYMHGRVADDETLPAVIDDCLRKGRWHEDRYWKP